MKNLCILYLSITPPNLSMMLVWDYSVDPLPLTFLTFCLVLSDNHSYNISSWICENRTSWDSTIVNNMHMQYAYFSGISRFPLKTVHHFRNFLALFPPPTLYKVKTRKKFWIINNNNNNNTNNTNNNNEFLLHQKIKLHVLCYNNKEDKKNYDKTIYISISIYLSIYIYIKTFVYKTVDISEIYISQIYKIYIYINI